MSEDTVAAFVSYCRDDSDFALRLAADLKAAGGNVWLDQLDILPGQRWDRAVENALTRCQRMIVVLSPKSVASDNVMDEVSFAFEQQKTVIPVVCQDCTIPFRLRRVQHADFRQNYERGLEEVLKTLGLEPRTGPGAGAGAEPQSRPPAAAEQVAATASVLEATLPEPLAEKTAAATRRQEKQDQDALEPRSKPDQGARPDAGQEETARASVEQTPEEAAGEPRVGEETKAPAPPAFDLRRALVARGTDRSLADLIGAKGATLDWRRALVFLAGNMAAKFAPVPIALAFLGGSPRPVWFAIMATGALVFTGCTLLVMRRDRNRHPVRAVALASAASGLLIALIQYPLGRNEFFRAGFDQLVALAVIGGIYVFLFLGALEVSLRYIKPLWLAMFLGAGTGWFLGYTSRDLRFVSTGLQRFVFDLQWVPVFQELLATRSSLGVFFDCVFDALVFASVLWLGLWLIERREQMLSG